MKSIRKIISGIGIGSALIVGSAIALFSLPGTGWKALSVQTGSMSPGIPTGSMVFVHRVPTSSLKIGDVITYNSMYKKGKTISHRITQFYAADKGLRGFVTKGDANKVPDIPIVAGQVKGKVMMHVPYLGKVSKLIMSWPVIIALVYLPALLVMYDELKRLSAYYRTLMPYKSAIILFRQKAETSGQYKLAAIPLISLALLIGSIAFAIPVQAMFQTNVVKLDNNNLNVTVIPPPNNTGGNTNISCTNNNNVNISSSTNQTATTGNANNTGNTNSQGASSGSVTNNNNTNVTVTINGC